MVLDNALLAIGLSFVVIKNAAGSRFGVGVRKRRAEEHVASVICRNPTVAWVVAVTAAVSPACAQETETVDQAL